MGIKKENEVHEAERLDREYTGDAVNARTDELMNELNDQTDKLRDKYVESDKPKAGC